MDPRTGRLNGIIDWDNTAIADPALDFMGAFEVSQQFGTKALESYGRAKSGYIERAEIYLETVPFSDIAWGIRTGARQFVEEGLRHLNHMFRPRQT